MARFFRGIPVGRIAFISLFEVDHDKVLTSDYDKLQQSKPVGFAGIRRIFMADKYGKLTPEFVTLTHMSCCSILSGVMFGSFLYGKQSWLDFMENNHATQFVNHFEAKRQLQYTMILAMGRGGLKWGIKIGAFSTIFLVSNTVIAAYNGQCGIIEYVLAGAITGGLCKINLGIKGIIAGTIVGTVLGTIAGAASLLVLFLTGYSMEDIQKTQYDLRNIRNDQRCQAGMKADSQETLELIESSLSNASEL